jgi:hypothetical protein
MSLFWPKVAECSRVMIAGCAVMTETKITHTLVFFPLVLCVVLSGCAWENSGSKPIPLRKAVHNFEKDVGGLHIVVLSDAYGATSGCSKEATEPDCWSEGGRAILDSIKFSQCFDLDDSDTDEQNPNGKKKPELRTKNPLISVATGPLQLTVQGQFTEGGTFTIAAAPSAAATISRQTTQQVMLPLTLVSLSALPGFYVGQQLANLQYTTLVAQFPPKDFVPPKNFDFEPEKKKQLEELKQTAHMVSFVMDAAAELTTITQFAENHFNKLPATEEPNKPSHYCFGFEEGSDVTASALKRKKR